jgi:hypothetical protein
MWTMVFIVFFAYFFISASIVGLEDGFDQTRNEKGYPMDFATASQWTNKEYIIWGSSWMPKKLFDIIVEKIKYKEEGGKGLDLPEED